MISAMRALLWERWRRTRVVFAIALLVPALYLLSVSARFAAFHEGWYKSSVDSGLVLSMMMGYFLIAYLLFAHCERDDIYLSFPRRLFRLPLRTSVLTAAYVGYGLLILACYCAILGSLCLVCFPHELIARSLDINDPDVNTAFSAGVVLFVAGFGILGLSFLYAQTFAWCFGSFSLVGTLMAGIVSYMFAGGLSVRLLDDSPAWVAAFSVIAFCIACLALCWASVAWQRRGGWQSDWRTAFGAAFRGFAIGSQARFRSPLHAQIWYEWRRRQRFLPFVFGAVCIALCALTLTHLGRELGISYGFDRATSPDALLSWLAKVAAFTAGCVSLIVLAVFDRDRASGALNFLFVRPMSTRTLAAAWLRAALRGLLIVVAVLVLAFALLMAASPGCLFTASLYGPFPGYSSYNASSAAGIPLFARPLDKAVALYQVSPHTAAVLLLALLAATAVMTWIAFWLGAVLSIAGATVLAIATVLSPARIDLEPAVTVIAATLTVLIPIAWLFWKTWRKRLAAVWITLLLPLTLLAVLILPWYSADDTVLAVSMLALAAITSTFWLFHAAWRKDLIRARTLLTLAFLALPIAPLCVGLLLWGSSSDEIAKHTGEFCGSAIALIPLPFVPVAALPLLLDRLRHR